jgi:hypothetical protein
VVILYIFYRFGILYQEKSGNPEHNTNEMKNKGNPKYWFSIKNFAAM